MIEYIAFLRGINVGGNTKLSMKDLAALCTDLGFADVRTYINSGNVLFSSPLSEARLEAELEKAIAERMKRNVKVVIRNLKELESIVNKNPFPTMNFSQIGVLLSKETLDKNIAKEFSTTGTEEVKVGKREVYISYLDGMGRSKLKWPRSIGEGTVRNMNTLSKLVELSNK